MATILMTWELGTALGHLMRMRPIATMLAQKGHRVVLAARDLTQVGDVFAGTDVTFMAAPWIAKKQKAYAETRSYAHILANIGFADDKTLPAVFSAWNTLFDFVKPGLVLLDHSPTALLALHGRPIPRANIGLGFFCPPPEFPLPFWLQPHEASLARQTMGDEKKLVLQINRMLEAKHRAPLDHLGEIYGGVNETILATYEEFDHFAPRKNVKYWGHWPFVDGDVPAWPAGQGPKIFGYIHPFPGLDYLLYLLKQLKYPAILYGIEKELQDKYQSPTICFAPRPLDLKEVGKQCDLAIMNAGHGAVVGMLLAGKPCLMFPLTAEQQIFSQKVHKLRAGVAVSSPENARIKAGLEAIVLSPEYRTAARSFSEKYAKFVPGDQLPEIVSRLDALICQ